MLTFNLDILMEAFVSSTFLGIKFVIVNTNLIYLLLNDN